MEKESATAIIGFIAPRDKAGNFLPGRTFVRAVPDDLNEINEDDLCEELAKFFYREMLAAEKKNEEK